MAGLSPTIGKIDGIPIELHWTFILLLLFILLLSVYDFILWVLLFVCVLVHELVHSINSKRNNIRVKKIVLYPFGGGSIIDFEKVNPEIEFRISIVGPIASLLIAAAFGIITIFTPSGLVKSTLQIMFLLNVFLGVFNLLPWLPLDGGRALRSYLQKRRSFLDATKLAVRSSNIVTVLFVIGTFIYAAVMPNYTLIYREFIVIVDLAVAFFIYGGAQAELQSAFVKEKISDLKAGDAISKNYILIKERASIDDIYKRVMAKKMHIVIFKNGEKFKVLSSSSIQRMSRLNVGNIENQFTPIPSIPYNLPLFNALERMRSEESGIAAVVKANKLVGILLVQHAESIIALHISKNKV